MDDQNPKNLTNNTNVSQPKPGDVVKPNPSLAQSQPVKENDIPTNGNVKVTDGISPEMPQAKTEPEVPVVMPVVPVEAPLPETSLPEVIEVVKTSKEEVLDVKDSKDMDGSKDKRKPKKLLFVILIAIVLFGLVGVGVYFFMISPMNGVTNVVEDETPESTESEILIMEPLQDDITSLKYLEDQFKGQDALVEELVRDTNFKESINIDSSNQSEFK